MKRKAWLCMSLIFALILVAPITKAEVVEPVIESEAAILMDAKSKTILYEKNAYSKQYPASITKLMTALLAIENLDPTDIITFSQEAIFSIEPGSSHIAMDVGEELTVDQALHGLMLESANEVANGLAEAVSGSIDAFAVRMTNRAKELGTQGTHFVNPHGLHDSEHYTTAYDMALIASYLADNRYFLEIMQDTTFQIEGTNKKDETIYLSQQHKMLSPYRDTSIYREDVIGGKTGYTDQARQTLVTIAKQGETTLVAVILKSEANSHYTDTSKLLDYGFDSYRSLDLHNPNETLKTLPMYTVKSGQLFKTADCSIGVKEPLSALVRNDIQLKDITTTLDLPEYLDINDKEGAVIGEITYLENQQIIGKNDLVIQKVNYQASPYSVITPEEEIIPSLTLFYAIALIAFLILVFICILWFKKRRKERAKRLKFKKLFK